MNKTPSSPLQRVDAILCELNIVLQTERVSHGFAVECLLLIEEARNITNRELRRVDSPTASDVLSRRELEVLQAMANGWSNSMIAEQMFISVNTVRFHVRNILRKYRAKNRTEVIARASGALQFG